MAPNLEKPREGEPLDSPYRVLLFMFVLPLAFVLLIEALGLPVTFAEWAASLL